jgi:hypothetical protein
MYDLGPNLGANSSEDPSKVQRMIFAMGLPVKEGTVFYNDLLFILLKRKYRPSIKRTSEKLRYMLMEREERSTLKQLAGLRRRRWRQNTAKVMREKTDNNLLFTLLITRRVLHSWHIYTESRKNGGSFKHTSPELSGDVFPGCNSPAEALSYGGRSRSGSQAVNDFHPGRGRSTSISRVTPITLGEADSDLFTSLA